MRTAKQIFAVLFAAALLSPALIQFSPLRASVMNGKVKRRGKMPFTLTTFVSGAWQQHLEQIVRKRAKIWSYLVKSDNQISYWLFHQLSNNYRASVVLGNEDTLIEKSYLKSPNRLDVATAERLEKRVRSLKELQTALNARGIGFFLLISPNKASLYPELIPAEYALPARWGKATNYQKFLPLLDKHGVTYLDGQRFFELRKSQVPFRFFANSGTHWNRYASCLITNELISAVEASLKKTLGHFSCDPWTWSAPTGDDKDLGKIVNLWTDQKFFRPVPQPANRAQIAQDQYKPNVLFVGTSFLWAVLKYLDRHRIYDKRDMLYYFRRNYSFPEKSHRAISAASLDWKKTLLAKDVVILEINESIPQKVGFGFVEAALKALDET